MRELELALYHERLPPLRKVMQRVNTELVHCACLQCQREGRWPCRGVIGAAYPGEGCRFRPLWEAYLRDLGVGVDVVRSRDLPAFRASAPHSFICVRNCASCGPDDARGKFWDTPAPVWTAAHEWTAPALWLCDYGWGRPLSSLDSPRRKVWDAVARCEYALDAEMGEAGAAEAAEAAVPGPAPASLEAGVALMTLG